MRNFTDYSKSNRCTPIMDAVRFARPPPALIHLRCGACRNASMVRAVPETYPRLNSKNDFRLSKNSTSQSPAVASPHAMMADQLSGIGEKT